MATTRAFQIAREPDLGLTRIANRNGLAISALPNGALFAIEHLGDGRRTLIGQLLGAPLHGGIGRLLLRLDGARTLEAVGPGARVDFGAAADRFVWEGRAEGLRHRVVLWLDPERDLWLWRVTVTNEGSDPRRCAATLVQDLGLGERGFVLGNGAFASQYIDHHVALHPAHGPVILSRQNLAQRGAHPWAAHACLGGAASYATDGAQFFGPAYRDSGRLDGRGLPGARLQHELACALLDAPEARLDPGATAGWTFLGLYLPDHPEASGPADLARVDAAAALAQGFAEAEVATAPPLRSLLQDAALLPGDPLDAAALAARYPERRLEERDGERLLSFFTGEGAAIRHVATRAKDRALRRRQGAILRTGTAMLPDETTLCVTCWMHGVFGALLSLGNTSFHRLLSAARDPYDIARGGGLRLLVAEGAGWRLLGAPSVFEMGLSDCRWIYRLGEATVTVRALASGADPALSWRVTVEGAPRRFLLLAGLLLGEREFEQAGRVEIDAERKRAAFRPDPESLWGRSYPEAVYHLVTATPGEIAAIGGDELAYPDGLARGGATLALETRETSGFDVTITGALADPGAAARLAEKYARSIEEEAGLAAAQSFWRRVTRDTRLAGGGEEIAEAAAALPWFAQNAMVHLTVPYGLEQSGGAAWGTRDVCQGPIEYLLAQEHDAVAREILLRVFARQGAADGDWPQWFMLPPYERIRDPHSHGDVILWPLKALCDYVEATGDLSVLDAPAAWRDTEGGETRERDPIATHVERLLATTRARFIPGTHLMRYGEGDWNDSLQPVDPRMRDEMVSAWTVALFYQQLGRYAGVLERAGRDAGALRSLAGAVRADFHRHLMRDGVVAGYAVFAPGRDAPELLLHPSDTRTGISYSLLPMKRGLLAGLFSPEEAARHLALIRAHLVFPDGARLMDRPVAYTGGIERIFRRAESASFFGREIGLMYVHAHLRYGEALAGIGEAEALWDVLAAANPVGVAARVANAAPRQRNAYFSSEDAAFPDRYAARADWARLREGAVPVEGGWRIYSSGPGLYTGLLLCHALGLRRWYGERVTAPVLPARLGAVTLTREIDGRAERWKLRPPGA